MKRRDFVAASLAGGVTLAASKAALAASGDIPAVRLSGKATVLEKAALAELAGRLRGTLILPAHAEYEQARRVWNPMIDKRPAVIARVPVGAGAGSTSFHLKTRTQDSLYMSSPNMLPQGGSEVLLFYVND